MTPQDFQLLQALMVTRTGYLLRRERLHLALHRLAPVARREGYASVGDLLSALREACGEAAEAAPAGGLAWAVIEALLNGETWFRRDRTPFRVFSREVLPAIVQARGAQPIRVWSAGCGSGQEAYSLALVAAEVQVSVQITASDLSGRALEKAQSGAYTAFEVQRGLSASQMLRWFEQGDEMWRVRSDLRQSVRFERANLLDDPPAREPFDIIFCRYVLGEMESSRRARALDILSALLADDGCLFLGLDEAIDERADAFRAVPGRAGLFVKSPSALRRAA